MAPADGEARETRPLHKAGNNLVSTDEHEWWCGQIVAHLGGAKTLVRVENHWVSDHRLDTEIQFQTDLIPLDLREVGTRLLVSWNPWNAKRFPENSN